MVRTDISYTLGSIGAEKWSVHGKPVQMQHCGVSRNPCRKSSVQSRFCFAKTLPLI